MAKRILERWGDDIQCKECQHDLRLGHEEKATLAKHNWETGHSICFSETKNLFQSHSWDFRLIRESSEIPLKKNVVNQEKGQSDSWLSLIIFIRTASS